MYNHITGLSSGKLGQQTARYSVLTCNEYLVGALPTVGPVIYVLAYRLGGGSSKTAYWVQLLTGILLLTQSKIIAVEVRHLLTTTLIVVFSWLDSRRLYAGDIRYDLVLIRLQEKVRFFSSVLILSCVGLAGCWRVAYIYLE